LNALASGVRDHEPAGVRFGGGQFMDIPNVALNNRTRRTMNELKVDQPKRQKSDADEAQSPAAPLMLLPRSERVPRRGDGDHDGRQQEREEAYTDNIFHPHGSLPFQIV
jgi:hypothetical protein